MNVHKNARLTPIGRERIVRLVESGQTPKAVAEAAGVCPRTVRKWVDRYRREGLAGLQDRSSRPHRLYRPTPDALVTPVEQLRRQRYTGKQIAAEKLGRIDGIGHRITGDRKGQSRRRGRGPGLGWEFVHVCIDDASRIAFAQIMPDEKKHSVAAFLRAAVAYYEGLGVKIARVMTDNGGGYISFAFRDACRDLGLRHIRTRPYRPQTNGKAERFIQTALLEWAYAKAYTHSDCRTGELPIWLHQYNWHRPHGSLKARTPISRLGLSEDNLLRLHN